MKNSKKNYCTLALHLQLVDEMTPVPVIENATESVGKDGPFFINCVDYASVQETPSKRRKISTPSKQMGWENNVKKASNLILDILAAVDANDMIKDHISPLDNRVSNSLIGLLDTESGSIASETLKNLMTLVVRISDVEKITVLLDKLDDSDILQLIKLLITIVEEGIWLNIEKLWGSSNGNAKSSLNEKIASNGPDNNNKFNQIEEEEDSPSMSGDTELMESEIKAIISKAYKALDSFKIIATLLSGGGSKLPKKVKHTIIIIN